MEEMGDRIKRLRSENHMTLEELGNKVGVGKSTVRKWENGIIANMRRDKIAKLSAALGVSPAYLMGWESSTTSSPKKVDSSEELVNIYEQLIPNNQKKSPHLFKEPSLRSADGGRIIGAKCRTWHEPNWGRNKTR